MTTPKSEGRKNDSEKPPLNLISRIAMEEEAKVMAFGAQKYESWNWSRGIAWSRVVGAGLRHLYAMADGELYDPETGLPHAAHARCCTAFLLDFMVNHPELNDLRNSIPDATGDSNQLQLHLGDNIEKPIPVRDLYWGDGAIFSNPGSQATHNRQCCSNGNTEGCD